MMTIIRCITLKNRLNLYSKGIGLHVMNDLRGKKNIVGVGAHMDDLWYGLNWTELR